MAELRLEKLTKVFPGRDRTVAVSDLTLTVASGECAALLGPSGAGKTTVLRLIAGLETPGSGEIYLDGRPQSGLKPGEREISMAFQYPALLPQLTVLENLQLGLRLRGEKARAAEEAGRVSRLLGLDPLLNRKPETLSGGEQQRAALGRALAARPRLLLLDEPLANLDPLSRTDLRTAIRHAQHALRVTTLYVTHDQAEAAAIAGRVALLRQGQLDQFSTPRELYHRPATLFAARFFGPDGLNTLEGVIERDGQARAGDFKIPITRVALPEGQPVLIGFRPADAALVRADSPEGLVIEKQDLGWTIRYRVALGASEILSSHSENDGLEAGERVRIQVDPAKVLLFDPQSGQSIR